MHCHPELVEWRESWFPYIEDSAQTLLGLWLFAPSTCAVPCMVKIYWAGVQSWLWLPVCLGTVAVDRAGGGCLQLENRQHSSSANQQRGSVKCNSRMLVGTGWVPNILIPKMYSLHDDRFVPEDQRTYSIW